VQCRLRVAAMPCNQRTDAPASASQSGRTQSREKPAASCNAYGRFCPDQTGHTALLLLAASTPRALQAF
jgi:hypothetical protein